MIQTIVGAVLWMTFTFELDILIKATVLLAIGLTAARIARRAQASIRHLLLAATLGALAALPLVAVVAPEVMIYFPPMQPEPTQNVLASAGDTNNPSAPTSIPGSMGSRLAARPWTPSPWPTIARAAWIAGVLSVCLSLLAAVWRVRTIRRHSLPRIDLRELVRSLAAEAGIRRSIDVLEHEHVAVPLTCGVRRPAIVLPTTAREWDAADVERALVHELEHVRRGDWVTQLAARLVCALYWFHPLAWVALREVCLEAERSCDDAVIRTAERTDYADQLVLLARRLSATHVPALLGMANRRDLSARVTALLDDRLRRGRAGIVTAASAVACATLLVVAIAPLHAAPGPNPDTPFTDAGQRDDDTQRRRVRAIDRALYEAAESGDIAEVDQLLNAGANVNAAVAGDGSPLIAAARTGRLSMVRHLLDRGADVNMPVRGDGSPLIVAAGEGAIRVIELLLDRGATVDQIVPADETALIQASGEGHLDVVKLLVARGANVNLGIWVDESYPRSEREWRSPLSMARKGGHRAVIEFLVAAGAQ